jgi:diguanylate cyclase (GGDEF)-like protein
MPGRDRTNSRRPRTPGATATLGRSAALRVGLIGALGAAVVTLAGGGDIVWLSVPAALLAAAGCRTRLGAAAATAVVLSLATGSALASASAAGRPALPLLVLVGATCTAVLVGARERVEREREVLRDFALSDPVTGIANRRSLLLRADYELARHQRAQRSFAVVMLDLDGFKQLNDRFGHAAGDDLLRDVATALRRAMRAQDTVARFGGDEFCILAPETDQRGAASLAAKVTQAVRDVSVGLERVGGSAGVAIFPDDGVSAPELLHAADVRLLDAKRRRHRGRSQRRAA